MPAASASATQTIDWSGIRAAAVAVGIREAARQAARNLLPHEQERFVFRVLKRAAREGWTAASTEAKAVVTQQQAKPLSSNVLSGSKAAANSYQEHGTRGRIAGAKLTAKALEHLAKQPAARIVEKARAAKDLIAGSAQAGGWETAAPAAVVNIALL